MKRVIGLITVFVIVAICGYGNGRRDDPASDGPADIVKINSALGTITSIEKNDIKLESPAVPQDFVSADINLTIPNYADGEFQKISGVSSVFTVGDYRYVVQDIHDLVDLYPDIPDVETYALSNKGLEKGQQLIFFPVTGDRIDDISMLIKSKYPTMVPEIDSEYRYTIGRNGSIRFSKGAGGRTISKYSELDSGLDYIFLIGKLSDSDFSGVRPRSFKGARVGTVLFNLDIFAVSKDVPLEDFSYLELSNRISNDGTTYKRFDNQELLVDFNTETISGLTSRLAYGVLAGNTGQNPERIANGSQPIDPLPDRNLADLAPLEGQHFLEPWETVFTSEYADKAKELNTQLYFTEHGLWFPIQILVELGEIEVREDSGHTLHRILKWPSNDRTHGGG